MINSLKYEILQNDYPSFDLSFKIGFIGDSTAGRSALLQTLNNDSYDTKPTVGTDLYIFNIKLEDKIIKLQLWDLPGQGLYRSLIRPFYGIFDLIVISYAINDKQMFLNINNWLNEAKSLCRKDCKFFLIGNKADIEYGREVSKEEGEKIAKEYNFDLFAETSSKLKLNIQYIFIQAAYKEEEKKKKYTRKKN